MKSTFLLALFFLLPLTAAEPGPEIVLFDGKSLEGWDFTPEGWVIEEDGSVGCRMEESQADDGSVKSRSLGYLWTKEQYGDFELTLSYRLSEGANTGVFYRSERKDPVNRGSEVQLMDNVGFQKLHGEKDVRKLNGSFYEGKGPEADPAHPVGEWDTLLLRCVGSRVSCQINGVPVFDVDVNDWPEVGKNPDGTANKFTVAIKEKPRRGYIGFQNHGQPVWFKDVKIRVIE
jgi:hypothetical protein